MMIPWWDLSHCHTFFIGIPPLQNTRVGRSYSRRPLRPSGHDQVNDAVSAHRHDGAVGAAPALLFQPVVAAVDDGQPVAADRFVRNAGKKAARKGFDLRRQGFFRQGGSPADSVADGSGATGRVRMHDEGRRGKTGLPPLLTPHVVPFGENLRRRRAELILAHEALAQEAALRFRQLPLHVLPHNSRRSGLYIHLPAVAGG